MDDAAQTMIENLQKNTGKNLEEWIEIVKKQKLEKHGEILKFLKGEHGFTHGFANLIAHKTLKSDAGSADDLDTLVQEQYKGKEHFLALYESIKKEIESFGNDIEIAPKKAYVSVRRKKQFAMIIPATKSRMEIGLNLKGQEPEGILEIDSKTNGMCSHKINLTGPDDWNDEVKGWLLKAYQGAG